ncbi:MAG: alcohol dehydrogenase catalytic domain-containing protein [Caldilineaceae bacterium]|nr:alcohol dehydrogenase catalytic domain-containing protein [Caldilineaceae bacterium]
MKQLVCPSTGVLALTEAPEPAIGPGDVLLELRACGICGTDVMKVYSHAVAKPVQLGHELVGTVVEAGAAVTRVVPGQRVAVAHHVPDYSSHFTRRGSGPMDRLFKETNIEPGGFAELIRVPALHVQHALEPVPDEMPDLRAVFMEPLACCLRTFDRVPVSEGDTTLIIGGGAVGLLFVPLLRDRSATVLVVDIRQERLALTREWGATDTYLAARDDVVAGVRNHTQGRGADQVILTVLDQVTLELAMAAVRDGGVIVLFGVKPGTSLPLDLWQVWRREINLVSSYSATPDLLPRAMAILRRPGYALESTVSHVLPLQEAPQGFELIRSGQASKVVISREQRRRLEKRPDRPAGHDRQPLL